MNGFNKYYEKRYLETFGRDKNLEEDLKILDSFDKISTLMKWGSAIMLIWIIYSEGRYL